MKLFASFSEAIREGAKLSPQAFGWLSRDGGTCALGSGLHVMGFQEPQNPQEVFGAINRTLEATYPYVIDVRSVACPILGQDCEGEGEPLCLREMILHLNDTHKWTREAIADWLETEEEKLGYVTIIETESHNEIASVVQLAAQRRAKRAQQPSPIIV